MAGHVAKLFSCMLLMTSCTTWIFADERPQSMELGKNKQSLGPSSRQFLLPVQGGYGIGDGIGGAGLGTGYPGFYGLAGLGPWGAGYGLITDTNPLTGITQGSRLVKFANMNQPLPEAIKNLMGSQAPNVNVTST